jgi:hypothetical protein
MSDKPSGANRTNLMIIVTAVCVLGLCVCGIGGVGVGLWLPRRASQREQVEAAAAAKAADKKAIAEAKKLIADVNKPVAMKPEPSDGAWLSPDKPAVIDGIKVELLGGKIGKVKLLDFQLKPTDESKDTVAQVRIRVTNNKQNYRLQYDGWTGFGDAKLTDEHKNIYQTSPITDFVGRTTIYQRRIDPGQSVEDVILFDEPLPGAKTFRLELDGEVLQKGNDKRIYYKVPRSFFEAK